MKLSRKNLGRVATTFLATAMLASLTAVPAMAADQGIYETGNKFTIDKTLTVPADVLTPNVTFTFSVTGVTCDGSQKIGGVTVESGTTGDVELSNSGAVFQTENSTQGTDVARTVDPVQDAEFTVKLESYDHAGIYKYQIQENTSTPIEGVNFGNEVKDLYVFIENVVDEDGNYVDADQDGENDLTVAYTMLVEHGEAAENNAEGKDDTFTNDYGKDSVFNLTLTKNITGNAANLSDTFTFKFTVNGNVDGEKYVMLYNGNKTIITEGEEQRVELGDDDSVTIYGLSKSDSYTITEEYGDKTGYSTTATINNGENVLENSSLNVAYGTGENEDITEAHNVVYTNSRDSAAPTGIAMDIAPYALLVVIAAAGCFVFLRKRNED